MNHYLDFLSSMKFMPKAFQSDFAREKASLIAEAASRGHITCLDTKGLNQGVWTISSSGTSFLKKMGGCV